jgi:hypothetical protein
MRKEGDEGKYTEFSRYANFLEREQGSREPSECRTFGFSEFRSSE